MLAAAREVLPEVAPPALAPLRLATQVQARDGLETDRQQLMPFECGAAVATPQRLRGAQPCEQGLAEIRRSRLGHDKQANPDC